MRGLFTCGVIDVFMENDITFEGGIYQDSDIKPMNIGSVG